MQEKDNLKQIITPKTLGELLTILNTFDSALILSGGTELLLKKERDPDLFTNRKLVYLGEIPELRRISRTERYLEIGAAATISRILNTGKNVITQLFYNALMATGTPGVKNIATLGGNICAASSYSTILPALFAIDARVEIRSTSHSNWIPITHFVLSSGKNILKPGEVLTRIRIPFREWRLQTYKKISLRKTQRISSLVFCGIAKTLKNVLTDIRLVYGAIGPRILRNREFESAFIGRKLPFSEKESLILVSELENILSKVTGDNPASSYKKATSLRLTRWFIDELNDLML